MASSKATGSAAGGKRGHIPTTGNPLFTTPAKPQSRKDKRNKVETENGINVTPDAQSQLFTQGQGQGQGQGMPHMTPQYLMPLHNQAYPYSQNVSGHVSFREEINSPKSMLGTNMTKLNKLDSIETTVEQIRPESAEVKTEVETVKTELREMKSKNKALEKKIIDLQSHSMQDNLVFYNIKEEDKYNDEEKVDTKAVLSNL